MTTQIIEAHANKFKAGTNTIVQMLLDHIRLTTGKASSLGGKLLHSGRRVEQHNYGHETIGSHGGVSKQ